MEVWVLFWVCEFLFTNRLCTGWLQAFFQKWWRQQSNGTKDTVKGLVSSGRLEFMYAPCCSNAFLFRLVALASAIMFLFCYLLTCCCL